MKTLVMLFCTLLAATAAAKPPNVVVVMSDDMGYSDVGCYGGEIRTPNLDALAAEGVKFTQFYNTARCCPSRASLLTGRYPHQVGVGHMVDHDMNRPGYRGVLSGDFQTVPEMLKPAGYKSYMAGKWHVTPHRGPDGPKGQWPLARGFDRFYGTIHGAGSYFDPSSLVRGDAMISAHADPEYRPKRYYYTDAITDHAVRFVRDHARTDAEKPFFLYVAYTAAHWPMHALPEDIEKYKDVYAAGYRAVQRERLKKQIALGLVPPTQTLPEVPADWDSSVSRETEVACMQVYAAMVDRMDQGIGRVVDALRESGQLDDTVIFYLQDNGGCAEPIGRKSMPGHPGGPRPATPTLPPLAATDFFTPGSVPSQTRDGFPVRMGPDVMPGAEDTYLAYGKAWATVSNTPLREYKHWVHEGGIATPLIVHWPNGKLKPGSIVRTPGHLIDLAATAAALPGVKGDPPLPGIDLVPALRGEPVPDRLIFWEHEGNRAVRRGDLKLVAKFRGPWELYDLARDRGETSNRAAASPAVVRELSTAWEAWAKSSQVEPWTAVMPGNNRPKSK